MGESQKSYQMEVGEGETEVEALCGFACQLCGTICNPGESMGWPIVGMEVPAEEVIVICVDCFDKYHAISEDALDAAAAQAIERQKKRRQSSPPYDETGEQALERDGHTCQLCGAEGYPRTDLGLAVFPVKAKNFYLRNLVTVCHECLKKDVVEVRSEAAQAKKWINAEQENAEAVKSNDENGGKNSY